MTVFLCQFTVAGKHCSLQARRSFEINLLGAFATAIAGDFDVQELSGVSFAVAIMLCVKRSLAHIKSPATEVV